MKKILVLLIAVVLIGSVNILAMDPVSKIKAHVGRGKDVTDQEFAKLITNEASFKATFRDLGISVADINSAWTILKGGEVVIRGKTSGQITGAEESTAVVVVPITKPQTAEEIALYQEEMLFNIPEVTGIQELDKLITLANIAPEAKTILALKVRAAKVPGVEQKHLDLFDHYVDTLPGVLKVRAEKRQLFNDKIEPNALLFIDEIRGKMQTLPGIADVKQKAKILSTLDEQVKTQLRKLYHFYFEAGSGMPDLQRAILNLYAKVKNAMAKVDVTRKPARSYYEVLGVAKNASAADIKRAFRALAIKNHPDKVAASEKEAAQERFVELNEAYAVLSDPVKRAQYDTGK